MILSEVRTTIRDRLITLGYSEWTGFSDDNVPNTILEDTFHCTVLSGSGAALKMHVLVLPSDVRVTIWKKGFRSPVEAEDAGLASIQEILCDLLSPAVRTLPAYRRIDLSSYSLEALSADNDTIIKCVINLVVETILEVTQPVT